MGSLIKSITKIDFGVEVNGWITDCAFTVAFNEDYKELLDGVKEATYTGIKNAAIDVHIQDWAKSIQEVMESYEVTIGNKTYPIQAIHNLGGHNILKNTIHGGVFLPSCDISFFPSNLKFEEGVYAIETFGSTKSNKVEERPEENTIYMNKVRTLAQAQKFKKPTVSYLSKLLKNFNTIPYCTRYLDTFSNYSDYKTKMDLFVDKGLVNSYPPLYCVNGGMTAQYEHTIYLSENNKIIFTNSNDY